MKKDILFLIFLFSILKSYSSDNVFNVIDFGAKSGNENIDNSKAFQTCLDNASKAEGVCFIPKGKYYLSKNLYIDNNTILEGEGRLSNIVFTNGGLIGKKNSSVNFYYTQNYSREIVPQNIKVQVLGKKGKNGLTVKNSNSFNVGDEVVIFNGKIDTWTILENSNKSSLWNSNDLDLFARGGTYKVVQKNGNDLIFDKELRFNNIRNAVVSKKSGVKNVIIRNIAVESEKALYAMMFEQASNLSVMSCYIIGKGGVLLSNYSSNSTVVNNEIKTGPNFAVNVENLSSDNLVQGNKVEFTRRSNAGKDCAIIVMLSSYNNIIEKNNITNIGGVEDNFGGIFVHSFSDYNIVRDNVVNNASVGIGSYYGALNNSFSNNKINNSRIGFMLYYSGMCDVKDNTFDINYQTNKTKYGLSIFYSPRINFVNNSVKGSFNYLIALQNKNIVEINYQGIKENKFYKSTKYKSDIFIKGSSNIAPIKNSINAKNKFIEL